MAEEHEATAQPQAEGGETTEQDMQVEEGGAVQEAEPHKGETGEGGAKRAREEGEEEEEGKDDALKKPRVDESIEGKEEEGEGGDYGEKEPAAATTATVGPKVFTSAVAMFDYFVKLLHYWSPNLDLNKYEHMVLLDLMKKGHVDPAKKIGEGVQAFQVRYHPLWKSRCFFVVRVDGTSDDFSFRKCVDNILPLPENMKGHSASDKGNLSEKKNQKGGGSGYGGRGGRGGGGRGGRGRGRKGGYGR